MWVQYQSNQYLGQTAVSVSVSLPKSFKVLITAQKLYTLWISLLNNTARLNESFKNVYACDISIECRMRYHLFYQNSTHAIVFVYKIFVTVIKVLKVLRNKWYLDPFKNFPVKFVDTQCIFSSTEWCRFAIMFSIYTMYIFFYWMIQVCNYV